MLPVWPEGVGAYSTFINFIVSIIKSDYIIIVTSSNFEI